MARICSRRKKSRWFLDIEVTTSFWILEPSLSTSNSRLNNGSRRVSRSLTDGHFQQMLALLQAEIQIGGDQIGQLGRALRVFSAAIFDLLGQGGRKFDDFLEFPLGIARQGGQFQGIIRHVLELLDARDQVGRFARRSRGCESGAIPPPARARVPSGNLSILRTRPAQPCGQNQPGSGFSIFGIALQNQPQKAIARHHIVNQAGCSGAFPPAAA